ncbi:MAG: hypothetical protein PHH21_01050 [Candidatus Pacebacteria bacterium]|nr:hypothetical protein [Candidatus Paceibacterota bacterium]
MVHGEFVMNGHSSLVNPVEGIVSGSYVNWEEYANRVGKKSGENELELNAELFRLGILTDDVRDAWMFVETSMNPAISYSKSAYFSKEEYALGYAKAMRRAGTPWTIAHVDRAVTSKGALS